MAQNPPFRADQVGSLLRCAAVHEARAKQAKGEISVDALKAVEDATIKQLIAKQESVGLKSITDGEIRRAAWTTDFLRELDGVSAGQHLVKFEGGEEHITTSLQITGKLGFSSHPMVEHFTFLKENTNQTPKMTIPSPLMLASPSRDWREAVDRSIYPTLSSMFDDLGEAYRKAVRAFHDAGCRYLQFDDCAFAFLCDAGVRKKVEARGDDPDEMMEDWIALLNSILDDKPADMTISTHMCRGNFRSTWLASGGYEPVADQVFNRINYDAYFLEYDSDRAGGFEPLRFIPKTGHKQVVLGLVTTKVAALESKDDIKRRIDQATAFVDLDRLCLSPQCGFASTEEGNALAESEQWRKLGMVVEIAEEVWGSTR